MIGSVGQYGPRYVGCRLSHVISESMDSKATSAKYVLLTTI